MGAASTERLTASLEDYLEAILVLVRRKRVARVRDISKRLGVGMPSVTTALRSLAKRELVNYYPYQAVTLTDRGRELAEEISWRHLVLRGFLKDVLGLDDESADANACRMEHAVDDAALTRLTRFAEFIRDCPRTGERWIEEFAGFCQRSSIDKSRCEQCLTEAVSAFNESNTPGDDQKSSLVEP